MKMTFIEWLKFKPALHIAYNRDERFDWGIQIPCFQTVGIVIPLRSVGKKILVGIN